MTRISTIVAALMLGGASVAWAGGADKAASDKSGAQMTQSSGSGSAAGASGSGSTMGQSGSTMGGAAAGQSSPGTTGSTAGAAGSQAGTSASLSSEDDVRKRLQSQGYSQITEIEKKGDKFEAKAQKNGKTVELEIDQATGRVTEQ
jgi:hypothetical protein